MSYTSDSQIADYTFANEHGIKRREIVASVIDALEIDTSAGQYDGSKARTVSLQFPNDIKKGSDRMVTQTLIEKNTLAHVLIPQGSRIISTVVTVNGAAVLDSKLAVVLGKSCPSVKGKDQKKALAGCIAGPSAPVTGDLLNLHKVISYTPTLGKDNVSTLNEIYSADAQAQGEDDVVIPTYTALDASASVGEPRSLYICGTVVDGTLAASDLSVNVTYVLPASEL
jgi:hypothetical protein